LAVHLRLRHTGQPALLGDSPSVTCPIRTRLSSASIDWTRPQSLRSSRSL